MPIKPENRALYPLQWGEISHAAKERAGWRCVHEGCGVRQYAVGYWSGAGQSERWTELGHFGHELQNAFMDARQYAAEQQFALTGDVADPEPKVIVIVLTTAHLDHNPENCDPKNLGPMCQRHHLRYDAQHHTTNAYMTRRKDRAIGELF